MTPMPSEFRQTLIGLEMLSHGAVTGYNKSAGRDSEHPGGRQPQGESDPPHIRFRNDWLDADNDAQRRGVERDALNELKAMKKRGAVPLTEVKSDRDLVIEDGAGYTPEQVSQRYGYSETTVRKWRREAKDPITGQPLNLDSETGKPEVPAEDGSTVREMGKRLGMSKSAAHRLKQSREAQRTRIERMFGKRAA